MASRHHLLHDPIEAMQGAEGDQRDVWASMGKEMSTRNV
jgi:ornithine carbamoyltransferase